MSKMLTPKVILVLRTMAKDVGKWHYTRELARMSKVGLGTVSSEFRKLAKSGLLKSKTEGQEKYYRLNLTNSKTRKICELFETEKRESFFKQNRRLAWILEDFTKKASDFVPEIQSVILFGSVARGQTTRRSDIDILILVPNYEGDKFKSLMDSIDQLASEVSGRHPAKLVPVVMTMKDFEQSLKDKKRFATDVLKDGILLFGEGRYYHMLSKVI